MEAEPRCQQSWHRRLENRVVTRPQARRAAFRPGLTFCFTVLTSLILFQQGVLHFHFALGPTNSVADHTLQRQLICPCIDPTGEGSEGCHLLKIKKLRLREG